MNWKLRFHRLSKLESIARKAGWQSGSQLVKNMQEYAVSAAQLKELDVLDHMILSKEYTLLGLIAAR